MHEYFTGSKEYSEQQMQEYSEQQMNQHELKASYVHIDSTVIDMLS